MFDRVRNPCHECQRRSVTCHGSCEDYAQYTRYREQLREARQRDHDVTDALIVGAERIKKQVFRHEKGKKIQ